MALTAAALAAMYAQDTPEQPVTLITVHNPDAADADPWPFRVCDDGQDLMSNGRLFVGTRFQLYYPDQEEGLIGDIRLGISAPPDDMLVTLKGVVNSPSVDIEMVLKSDPHTIMRSWEGMVLRKINADRMGISFEFRYEDLSDRLFPPDRFSFPLYPSLF